MLACRLTVQYTPPQPMLVTLGCLMQTTISYKYIYTHMHTYVENKMVFELSKLITVILSESNFLDSNPGDLGPGAIGAAADMTAR